MFSTTFDQHLRAKSIFAKRESYKILCEIMSYRNKPSRLTSPTATSSATVIRVVMSTPCTILDKRNFCESGFLLKYEKNCHFFSSVMSCRNAGEERKCCVSFCSKHSLAKCMPLIVHDTENVESFGVSKCCTDLARLSPFNLSQ
jgi:hypothetical protein